MKNFLMLIVAVFSMFFVASCGLITRNFSSVGSAVNENSANKANANETTTAYDSEKFQKLLDAGTEIAKMSLPVKLDPKPVLKGKVFVFKNVEAGSKYSYDDGISGYRKAHSLDELQTAIRIVCQKGSFLGDFQGDDKNIKIKAKGYGIDCKAELIDYPAKTIFAQKTFSNNEKTTLISQRDVVAEVYLNPPPYGEITRYINSLPVDKVSPEMTSLDEKELIRLPTTESLKPEAALKGKIAYARENQETDIVRLPDKIDGYFTADSSTDKRAFNPDDLETFVKIVCGKGDKIGQTGTTTQYANRCEVSLIDYKTLTVFSKKVIENKNPDDNPSAKDSGVKIWVTKFPDEEIKNYLKSLPVS